ncbi:MAG: hypothetical protein HW416_2165 [Chloroflexi bacterium]|nr:hypothetical protein [Chloroflexota bacterium]
MPRTSSAKIVRLPEPEIRPIEEHCERHVGEWMLLRFLDPYNASPKALTELIAFGPSFVGMHRELTKQSEREERLGQPPSCLGVEGGGIGLWDPETLWREIDRMNAAGEWLSVNPW